MIKNPISEGISSIRNQYSQLNWEGGNAVPSAITCTIITIVLVFLVLLWPYGLFAVMEALLREIMQDTAQKMEHLTLIGKMPYVMALGLYFCFWLPFIIICLPMILIGWIGSLLTK